MTLKKLNKRTLVRLQQLATWRGPPEEWCADFPSRQLPLIELLADPTDTRTKRGKSLAAGYNPGEVYRLQQNPLFREAVLRRMLEGYVEKDDALASILARIVSRARYGWDRHAIKAADVVFVAIRTDAEARQCGST